jgi:hypothetical protein
MDAVSVESVSRGGYGDVLHLDASGAVEFQVAIWTVGDPDVTHGNIEVAVELEKLEKNAGSVRIILRSLTVGVI